MARTKQLTVKKQESGGRAHGPDYILLAIVTILLILGLVTLFSASTLYGKEKFNDAYFFIRRQLLFGFMPGFSGGVLVYFLSQRHLKKISPLVFLVTLLLSFLVVLPHLGMAAGGAARWLRLGPITFQPSEFLKIGAILYFAALFSKIFIGGSSSVKTASFKNSIKILAKFFALLSVAAIPLFLQPDVGTLGVIIILGFVMYFMAKAPLWHLGLAGGLVATLGLLIIKLEPYRLSRLAVFFNSKTDPLGIGYQINQILIAIGSGGLTGFGLGMSRQKFGFLPQPMGDSIFAIFGEELGFIGVAVLLSLIALFVWRGLTIARNAPASFEFLAAVGITSWIALQAFINIGSMTGLIPLTGIPLPFFSYGGSALTANLIAIGLLLNISKHTI